MQADPTRQNHLPKALIVGCGFVGEAAADLFCAAGWGITAWTSSPESAARLAASKPYPVVAQDITDAEELKRSAQQLGAQNVVLDCVSSKGGGAEAYRRVYLEGARNLLAAFQTERFIYTGSTSVYAQTDGAWVDESSPAEPDRETGRILRETEELVLSRGGSVARLAGLYGPGRSVLLSKFLDGNAAIGGDGSRWMNFCHRDDAAAALLALANAERPPGVWNVADDMPLTEREVYAGLCEIFQRSMPPSVPIDLNRKRGWTSKRVSNQRLREIGWQPKFASFFDYVRSEVAAKRKDTE